MKGTCYNTLNIDFKFSATICNQLLRFNEYLLWLQFFSNPTSASVLVENTNALFKDKSRQKVPHMNFVSTLEQSDKFDGATKGVRRDLPATRNRASNFRPNLAPLLAVQRRKRVLVPLGVAVGGADLAQGLLGDRLCAPCVLRVGFLGFCGGAEVGRRLPFHPARHRRSPAGGSVQPAPERSTRGAASPPASRESAARTESTGLKIEQFLAFSTTIMNRITINMTTILILDHKMIHYQTNNNNNTNYALL